MLSADAVATKLPLVVIVTPVYNGARYLQAAMESVQAQTYGNLIHLILDNASTDETAAIAAHYQGRTVETIYHRNEKLLPLTDNWDKAFSLVPRSAIYVKLLCADDLMHPACIQEFVDLAEANPRVETVSCHDVHDDKVRRANIKEGQTTLDGRRAAGKILDRSIGWLPFQHLFVRMHPEFFEEPFFGTGEYGADPYAVARSALRGQFGYVHKPLVYTRWHSESASNSLARDGRTPLFALQINMMLVTYHKMLLVFGRSVWSGPEYARRERFSFNHLVRTFLRWRMKQFDQAADELGDYIRSTGRGFGLWSCIHAILGLPSYMAWKRTWRTKIGPTLGEKTFIAGA